MPTFGVYLTDDEASRLSQIVSKETPGRSLTQFLQEVARTYLEDNDPRTGSKKARQ